MGDTNINLPDLIPEAIEEAAKKVSGPLSTGIGKTFGDCWYLAFGWLSQIADKQKIKNAVAIEIFKKTLEEKLMTIPEERRVEPDTQTVGQALEASKYCVENKEIREMFANLIASTMDSETANLAHPSFPEILKQMSAFDAQIFKLFLNKPKFPVCEYRRVNKAEKRLYLVLNTNVFLEGITETNKENIEKRSISIAALIRSGLLNTDYEIQISDESVYEKFEQTQLFREYKHKYSEETIKTKNGLVNLTPLGKSLLKVCFPSIDIDNRY